MQTSLSLHMPLKSACTQARPPARQKDRAQTQVACAHPHTRMGNAIPIIEQHTRTLADDQGHQNIPGLCLKKTNVVHWTAFWGHRHTNTRTQAHTTRKLPCTLNMRCKREDSWVWALGGRKRRSWMIRNERWRNQLSP